MITQSDQDITREVVQYSQEYVVADQIRKLIENERFKIHDVSEYDTEFDISLEYSIYHWGHLAHDINSYLEGCICQFNIPDELQMKYDYTVYDGMNPVDRKMEIIRSGYVVEIQDPEHVDHISWDGAMLTSHNFQFKFRILGERIPNCSNLYDGMFKLRIPLRGQGSARRVVNILKEILKPST